MREIIPSRIATGVQPGKKLLSDYDGEPIMGCYLKKKQRKKEGSGGVIAVHQEGKTPPFQ